MGLSAFSNSSSPLLDVPIASGFGAPIAVSLAFGASTIDPASSSNIGSLVETLSAAGTSAYTTRLTYNGAGYLEFLAWWGAGGGSQEVRLTVDGVQIFTDVSAADKVIKCSVGGVSRVQSQDAAGAAILGLQCVPGRMPFRGSILIESKFTTAAGGQVGYKLVKTK